MEKSKKKPLTTESEKKKKYRKHINHEVTRAVCGKKFGSSRSTAKYCSTTCRRKAYYAIKGYLGRIVPTRIKVPKISDSMPIEREADELRVMLERAKTKVAEIRAAQKPKTLLFVHKRDIAKWAKLKTGGESKRVANYIEPSELKKRIRTTFGNQANSILVADLTYVVIADADAVKALSVKGITIEESRAKTVCPELL